MLSGRTIVLLTCGQGHGKGSLACSCQVMRYLTLGETGRISDQQCSAAQAQETAASFGEAAEAVGVSQHHQLDIAKTPIEGNLLKIELA